MKRIFSMCMEGRGPTQIANQLWVDKVLTPSAYKLRHGLSTISPAPEDPYRWYKRAVSSILERLEYTGCTVNFKTYTNSIWDKKRQMCIRDSFCAFSCSKARVVLLQKRKKLLCPLVNTERGKVCLLYTSRCV